MKYNQDGAISQHCLNIIWFGLDKKKMYSQSESFLVPKCRNSWYKLTGITVVKYSIATYLIQCFSFSPTTISPHCWVKHVSHLTRKNTAVLWPTTSVLWELTPTVQPLYALVWATASLNSPRLIKQGEWAIVVT